MRKASARFLRIFAAEIVLATLSTSGLPAQEPPQIKSALKDKVTLQLIVVPSLEEARGVVQELKNGADFGQIAKRESIDPTAETGGVIGAQSLSVLRPELRAALQKIGPGQFTEPVEVPLGYAVLKIRKEEVSSTGTTPNAARTFGTAATGAVKYGRDVDGLAEAEATLIRFPKSADWNQDPQNVCRLRKQSLDFSIKKLNEFLAPEREDARQTTPPFDVMQAHYGLAQLYSYEGDMNPAVAQFEAAYHIAQSDVQPAIPQVAETLGIAYLHKSEMENEVYHAPGERCLFPPRKGVAYSKPEDSLKAAEYFLKYLDAKPDDMEARWLLNLAYMTLGNYPEGVPKNYLIPPSAFESKEEVGRFVDVATESGLKSFSTAGGVIVEDFKNNGLFDVVTSGFESCAPMHYFKNNGDGTFTENTEKSGLTDQVGGLNLIQTDYNNDGCMDIFVLRGGWEFPQRKSLLRGNCDGTFTDVTIASGLAYPVTSSQAAVWADINNDGFLDLFIVNESGRAQLFLNNGDGTFKDIAVAAGVAGDGTQFSKGVAAADYDNDGYIDFYVSNLNGSNFLYHNNHDNTFTEVAVAAGVPGSGRGFATWFFDYDNDGLPDLFATSYFQSVDETMRTYLDLPHNATTLKLYKNLGNGKFRDVTDEVALNKVFMPMGANFGDIDNDGFLDMYLGTGSPSYSSILPKVLLRNHDGKYFVDITTSSGTGELHKGHAVVFADLANNGNEDIIESVGGATIGDSHALRLFANPGHGNDWISLKLVGKKTNRAAIGARIKVTVQNEDKATRAIYRTVGSGGSFGASPLQQHIGLGNSAKVQSIEIDWPASRTRQVFTDPEKNQFLEITEFAETFKKLDRKSARLGGAKDGESASSLPVAKEPARNNQLRSMGGRKCVEN